MAPGMGGLPAGTRFLHIGPYKTGTTAVQGALHLARSRLGDQGLAYIGKGRQPTGAAQQAAGIPPMFGSAHEHGSYWQHLLDEVAEVDAGGDLRPVISSEFFCEADDEAARRIVDDLGGSRVHVIVTLRPLAKILPAQWQQFVQAGLLDSYEEWLDAVFNRPPSGDFVTAFWRRHDHGSLVGRWCEIVGRDNLTVISVDDSDPGMLLRSFEDFLDLPDSFLTPDESQANRSLTHDEAEFFRRFNREFLAYELDELMYGRYIRRGLAPHLKVHHRPAREDSGIRTPAWAMERAAKLGAQSAATISGLQPRIVGDLSLLSEVPHKRVGDPYQDGSIPVEAAAHALVGALAAFGRAEKSNQKAAEKEARAAARKAAESARKKAAKAAEKTAKAAETARLRDPDRLPNVSARRLARELLKRATRKAARAGRRIARALHLVPR